MFPEQENIIFDSKQVNYLLFIKNSEIIFVWARVTLKCQ